VTVEECRRAEKAAARHPDLRCMVGFMRRFDPSYREVRAKIDAGVIGSPILFRGYSVDPIALIDGALSFAPRSGGQFLDMAVHDFDLARWYLGSDAQTVAAFGGCYAYEEFGRNGDGDSVAALMLFENGTMGFFYAGRLAAHGYNVETEIIGTGGALRVASVPQKNLVEVLGPHGVSRECSGSFMERFGEAFVSELTHFVDCVLDGRTPHVSLADGTAATTMAVEATRAFRSGELQSVQRR
jgi:myo-inositol 2-dehydrogenase/D-chiro-inositol 1-dehydrogenase